MFTLGVLLTFVIDMFMFYRILTPVYYCFLKVTLISLSLLMGCFNSLERSLTNVTYFGKITLAQ